MQTKETFVSLDTLAQGAAVEMFNDELKKVLTNILDPNTKATAKRTLVLTVEIKPDEDRFHGSCNVFVKSKLEPNRGVGTVIFMGRHAGEPVASERDERQLSFDDSNVANISQGGAK
jgi:hypothetical protein